MKTYAIADLHGRRDLLDAAITAITERGGGTVVFLGDYINRGPDSRGVIERLMAGPPDHQVWKMLAGNHEAYVLDAFNDLQTRGEWLKVGGRETLISYGWNGIGNKPNMDWIPIEHRAWIRRLPVILTDLYRVYVHAGVDPTLSIEDQSQTRLLWKCHADGVDLDYRGRHIVHGHQNLEHGPLLLTNRTNLDTWAWKTGRLSIGMFDDEVPGGPIEIITIQRDKDPR